MFKLKSSKLVYCLQSILHSYSLIFFSLDYVLAVILLVVTFFSPEVGFSGFCAVVLTNIFAYKTGLPREEIRKGVYGFNALFLGLALGYEFNFNLPFLLLYFTAIVLLLMITAWLNGYFSKRNLPFLSLPFLLTYWIISLASSNLMAIQLDENHSYSINEIAQNQSDYMYYISHIADEINIGSFAVIYFKTLSATFFQNSVFGGMLIACGLLYFSRITFTLTLIGFATPYLFYSIFNANVNDLNYHLLGSNFIFLAIAIGSFYLIPNTYSYLSVVLLIPVLILLLIFFAKILAVFQLKPYTFSFNFLCIAFLVSLNQRWFSKYLHFVPFQYFSPEKTIYKYLNSIKRFKYEHLSKIALPFWGEWMVSQGYQGKITHIGAWSDALDFVVLDTQLKTYREPGISKEDFYAYNKPVTAPLDGYVYEIINNVDDNNISDINTEKNWGNTIIMNHLNGLFSQISHIKKDSFKVAVGDYINKGIQIGNCGNSGRSPEPHIHFQMQTSAVVGAKTIGYPISYFMERNEKEVELKISSVPKEGTFISNVQISNIIKQSFSFIPGMKISFENENTKDEIIWEIFTDAFNRTYIYCQLTKSYAYFVNDGTMFYFTDFEGKKGSLLFYFYLAAYRQLLGYYDTIEVTDLIPLIHFNSFWVKPLQDFVAPFYLFTKASFTSVFAYTDNINNPDNVKINSTVKAEFFNRSSRRIDFAFELVHDKINIFEVKQEDKINRYLCHTY